MGKLNIMNKSGDNELVWSAGNPQEVAIAEQAFDAMILGGYFAVAVQGDQKQNITQFDPNLENILMFPKAVGG